MWRKRTVENGSKKFRKFVTGLNKSKFLHLLTEVWLRKVSLSQFYSQQTHSKRQRNENLVWESLISAVWTKPLFWFCASFLLRSPWWSKEPDVTGGVLSTVTVKKNPKLSLPLVLSSSLGANNSSLQIFKLLVERLSQRQKKHCVVKVVVLEISEIKKWLLLFLFFCH